MSNLFFYGHYEWPFPRDIEHGKLKLNESQALRARNYHPPFKLSVCIFIFNKHVSTLYISIYKVDTCMLLLT